MIYGDPLSFSLDKDPFCIQMLEGTIGELREFGTR